jgi:hypothetical protein
MFYNKHVGSPIRIKKEKNKHGYTQNVLKMKKKKLEAEVMINSFCGSDDETNKSKIFNKNNSSLNEENIITYSYDNFGLNANYLMPIITVNKKLATDKIKSGTKYKNTHKTLTNGFINSSIKKLKRESEIREKIKEFDCKVQNGNVQGNYFY